MIGHTITNYSFAFLMSFLISVGATLFVRKVAVRFNILDYPDNARKLHASAIPLMGGLAIFISLFIALAFFIFFTDIIWTYGYIKSSYIIGIFGASIVLMMGGFLDDKYRLKPRKQLIFPILAILIIIFSGIGVNFITNPFGGIFRLDSYQWEVLRLGGDSYRLTPMADFFIVLWLLVMMYTTKLLDGLDGLVSGLGMIGSLIIFFLSVFPPVNQPGTALIALIFSGACAGFFIFNFYPAKIFLGEGGSLFIGFMLGVLAIIAGGKIATTLLIVGLPLVDVVLVMARRLFIEHKSIAHADRTHFHFKLLDMGMSQRQTVVIFLLLAATFGFSALFLKTVGKVISFGLLSLVLVVIISKAHRSS